MTELKIEDYREHYNLYFKEFNRLAVGEYADLSYGNDKPNDTASSLESIISYSNYIIQYGNKSKGGICDNLVNAGAGASSFIFRKIFGNDVICVDPNLKYLKLIEIICKENKVPYMFFFKTFSEIYKYSLDHVYYDYGSIERLPYLGLVIESAKRSVYVDDSDCRDECMPYRNHVIALCEEMKLKWFDCLDAKDSSGRWGIIIEK